VWKWSSIGFRAIWRSLPGDYRELRLGDVDGDGIQDIGVTIGG